MSIRPVETNKAPAAIGPYSQAVIAGGLVFVSGQLPVDPGTGEMPEDIGKAAEQALKNVGAVLEAAGTSLASAVKLTVFLTDMGDFPKVNGVYQSFFSEPYPARACVEVRRLPRGARIEIEAVAALPE
jgi:2-iminobutanoate/2-iminopropanoate deaminase